MSRFLGQLRLRGELLSASGQAATDKLKKALDKKIEAIRNFGDAMDQNIDRLFMDLTPTERAQVVHLVEHEDECILDAIVKVAGAESENLS